MSDPGVAEGMTASERAAFGEIADILVPQTEAMPSATGADVASRWIDVALSHRPDLRSAFGDALAALAGRGPDAVWTLAREAPEKFQALATLTAGAYYLNPEVRALVGYPGQTTRDFDDEVPSYSDLLEHVVSRGPRYRPTPR
ncbi:MAG TPA: hypothetical protein VND83_03110 [Acidimicrobiales bacterium]|nr:hypothetical protein [Acidimicrobiales bacterium]